MQRSKLNLLLLAATAALSPLAAVGIAPSLPVLRTAFDASTADVPFVMSIFMVGMAIAQLLFGPLSDRIGRRPVLLGSLVLYSAASIFCAMAPALPVLIAARLVQACGAAGLLVTIRASLHDAAHGDAAASAMALLSSAGILSHMVSPVVGGSLGAAFGWASVFYLEAGIGCCAFLFMLRLMPETRLRDETGKGLSASGLGAAYRRVLGSPRFHVYTIIYGINNAAFFSFLALAPIHFADHFQITGAAFGVNWSLISVASFASALIGARLVKRVGRRPLMTFVATAGAIGGPLASFSAYSFSATPIAIMAPLVALAALLGMIAPLSQSEAIATNSSLAGTASGLSGGLASVYTAAAMALGAAIYDGSGFTLVLPVAATTLAVAVLCRVALWLNRRAELAVAD